MEVEGKQQDKWACHRCTYLNSQYSTKCELCESTKPDAKLRPISRDDEPVPSINGRTEPANPEVSGHQMWKPVVEGTKKKPILVDDGEDICAKGNLHSCLKINEEKNRSMNGEKWICKICTLENGKDKNMCEVCGEPRPRSAKPPKPPLPKIKFPNITDKIVKDKGLAENPKQFQRQTSLKVESIREDDESKAIKEWQEIISLCREAKVPFVDDSFLPNDKSLVMSGGKRPMKVKQWRRPHEIVTSSGKAVPWVVFRDPRPSDIMQGILGNCWLLSALSVISERPELLEKVLITRELCREGAYQIRLCRNGKWKVVLVDDLFPCGAKGELVYSQASRNQLWVPIIEKAVAKLYGSYEALVAGRAIEGLELLTGCPCESIMLKIRPGEPAEGPIDSDLVWARLLSSRDAGFIMGASCGGDVDDELLIESYKTVGLQAQHAYSVLDVRDVGGNRLLRLRNPWGRYSWTGAWSDQSELWTPELRNNLMAHGAEEGVFWISVEDMMEYFDCVDVCKVRPDWTEMRISGKFPCGERDTGTVSILHVFSPTDVDISLFQKSNRGSKTESIASLDILVSVFRTAEGVTQPRPQSYVAHSPRKIKPSVGCNIFLEAGVYLVVPSAFNHWHTSQTQSPPHYTLTVHSSQRVFIDQVIAPKYTQADALFLLCQKNGKTHEKIPGITCYYFSKGMSGLIIAAENRRSDMCLHLDCNCSESFNVVSSRGCLETHDVLPPLSRQIVILLTQLEGNEGYSVSHKLKFRIATENGFGSKSAIQNPPVTQDLKGLHEVMPL
eukprot:Seg1238.1 transcript_id=Seg1238.1/GoldUCD/mRNA.D3Y31 product=Calpain-D protein_id=Seg1238.1/GoldUCD/D3Y31